MFEDECAAVSGKDASEDSKDIFEVEISKPGDDHMWRLFSPVPSSELSRLFFSQVVKEFSQKSLSCNR